MINLAISMMVAALALPGAAAAQTAAPSPEQPARMLALPSLEELNVTRGRPLFSPRRRPDAKVAAPKGNVVEEPPTSAPFDLTGIVLGEDHAIAILQNRDTQETVHLKQGESAEVWSVAEIGQRHVVLRNEGRQVRLQLFEPRPDGSEPMARPPIDYERPRPRRPVAGEQSSQRRSSDRERERERRRRQQMLRQQQN